MKTLDYASAAFAEFFPRAKFYAPEPLPDVREIHERGGRGRAFPYSERHLQCVWFDPMLRPAKLTTSAGEDVVVEDPGVWNLEAGPDFLGAALRLGPEQRRITGDVEIHIHAGDWRNHGHRADPRYDRVRVHVTYFPGPLDEGELPPGAIQIALKDPLAALPGFSFENTDVTAYPYAARAAVPPCMTELKNWAADARGQILDAAGEERLRRKAERTALDIADKGREQAIYEDVMCALGFKNNKSSFRQLSTRVPGATLRAEAGGDPDIAYALLLGVSGLMPDDLSARWDAETRAFVRSLWDAWWKRRDRFHARIMPRTAWQLSGIRPTNHPQRRLAAAAWLFTRPSLEPERIIAATHDYWNRRLSLGGKKQDEPVALVGKDRADAILTNVVIPLRAAEAKHVSREVLDALPPDHDNAIVRQTAFNLLGRDHNPKLYRSGLRRQGLIQVFHDYCLNDRSRCATCTFPALLKAHRGTA